MLYEVQCLDTFSASPSCKVAECFGLQLNDQGVVLAGSRSVLVRQDHQQRLDGNLKGKATSFKFLKNTKTLG